MDENSTPDVVNRTLPTHHFNPADNRTDWNYYLEEFKEKKITDPDLSVREYAEANNLAYPWFLQKTKLDPKYWEYILNETRKRYHFKSIGVDDALEKKAKTGDPRAIQLWYERMEGWREQNPGGVNISFIIPISMIPQGKEDDVIELHAGHRPMIDTADNSQSAGIKGLRVIKLW